MIGSKVVKQLAGNGQGQSLADRVNAAKFSLAGSGLGRGIVKATTEELIPPKKKHLDYLTTCTNEISVSLPELAELLVDRTQQVSWVIVMKAFITTHHLLNFGNEKFSQYMAARNNQIYLPNFVDKASSIGYEMSQYIKVYSKYVNEKSATYRLMAFDFCKIKRGKDDGVLRRMPLDKLMKTLPILQGQIDVLLEFDSSTKDLANPVLSYAFTLLYKDLIRLYASYNEGMINLIEQYFSMSRRMCREALALYKGFLQRTDKVNAFVTVAEAAGVGDKAALGLQSVPAKVLQTLENHLNNLEKRSKSEDEEEDDKQEKSQNVNSKVKEEAAVKQKQPSDKPVGQAHRKLSGEVTKKESSNGLEDLLLGVVGGGDSGAAANSAAQKEAPVHTQLRRPEQHQSVTVKNDDGSRDTTGARTGRSPSPNRRPPPMRPSNTPSRSRDVSPARPTAPPTSSASKQNLVATATEGGADTGSDQDLFLNLRNDASGRVSPFAGDEKPIDDSNAGSFWGSDIAAESGKTPKEEENGIDFAAAFKDDQSQLQSSNNKEDQLKEEPTTNNAAGDLLDLDLFGTTTTTSDEPAVANVTEASDKNSSDTSDQKSTQKIPDLDDLFGGLGDISEGASILAPQTVSIPITPAAMTASPATTTNKPNVMADDLLESLNNASSSSNVPKKNVPSTNSGVSTSSSQDNPKLNASKPAAGLDDTLAALAQSLGRTDNKWSSDKKAPTLAGKTLGSMTPSSGPTIDWVGKDSSSHSTTNEKLNSGDIMDLLG